jgi:hypothetical protein
LAGLLFFWERFHAQHRGNSAERKGGSRVFVGWKRHRHSELQFGMGFRVGTSENTALQFGTGSIFSLRPLFRTHFWFRKDMPT